MLILEHTAPFLLILAAVLAAGLAALYSAWRYLSWNPGTVALTGLHLALLAGLFWCLLQPGCRDASRELIKPRFIVALDTSRSMTVRPNERVDTRFDRARSLLEMPWTDAVAAESDIELLAFDATVRARQRLDDAAALEPVGETTRLRDAMRDIAGRYTGLNIVGMLLLSDGRDTREALDDWAGEPYPFPIYTVKLEDSSEWIEEPDLRIEAVVTPRRVTSGWETELKAVISGQGTLGQPAAVQVFKGDVQIADQPVLIPADGGQREVVFTLQHPDVGVFEYRVHVPPLLGEKQTADNDYRLTIAVQDPRNRLLYVEGVPRFEYRFLRRVLLAQESLSPAIFYTAADGSPRGGSPAEEANANMSEADLLEYKIVILGNLGASELTEARARNLVRFVENGGSLVLLGGTRAWGKDGFADTPLKSLLPMRSHGTEVMEAKDPFVVELSETARVHPAFSGDDAFWSVIPPVLSVFPDAEPKPGTEVLVRVQTPRGLQPMVLTQRYGQGRVAAVMTDSLWRWQLTPETQQQPYARFWTQLLEWMLPEDDSADQRRLELFSDRDQLSVGEELELSARYPNPEIQAGATAPMLRITLPDGRVMPYAMEPRQVVTPGGRSYPGFGFRYEPELPGFYTVKAESADGMADTASDLISFQVRAFSPETAPRPVRDDLLRMLAGAGGGRYFETIEAADRALRNLQVSVIEEERVDFASLWRRWAVVALLMLLAAGMWVARKSRSMP